VSVEIEHGNTGGTVLAVGRRLERIQCGSLTELGNVDMPRVVDAHVVRSRKVGPLVQRTPVEIENLNTAVLPITHQHTFVRQHQHRMRDVERAVFTTRLAPGRAEITCRRELMNARVAVAV
jgi:hypothetical protein